MKMMLKDVHGSVIVEAAFIFSFLSILTVGLMEYGFWYANKSQIDRTNYSIASLMRERTKMYNSRETFTQEEVKQLYTMANALTNSHYKSSLCVRVEGVYFASGQVKKVSHYQSLNYGSGLCNEIKTANLKNKIHLSPYSSRQRWLPLYQVTLIADSPNGSLDKLLKTTGLLPNSIASHNIVLVR